MPPPPEFRSGLDYLSAATELLQRSRAAHPTEGLFEAADLQWWWRDPRPTDEIPQLFWFDETGRPEAAVVATQWRSGVTLAVMLMPDAAPDWTTHVIETGAAHAVELGFASVDLEVAESDQVTRAALERIGFTTDGENGDSAQVSISVVESWLAAEARPAVSALPAGYRLTSRADENGQPHHMIGRSTADLEARLQQTSLYRPDLDLVVVDEHNQPAAYGLFWFDPTTATGLVEPMRTEDAHQRRGLARHVLTNGIDRLADVGARRIKICFEPDNDAASRLYLGVGFQPVKQTVVYSRRPAS